LTGSGDREAVLRIQWTFEAVLVAVTALFVYGLCIVSPLLGAAARATERFWPGNVLVYTAVWIPAFAGSVWSVRRTRGKETRLFRVSVLLLGITVLLPILLLGDSA
jgi:uncharacterized membrane-anchored protein